ncbi:MAG: hypothetical protein FWD76_02545 [Firmicutes bacterium]|nr:hypothetical protein [Bacillota bacterium]
MKQFFKKWGLGARLKKMSEWAADALFPPDIKCIVCESELKMDTRYGVCPQCEIVRNSKFCTVCGNGIRDMAPVCDHCKTITHEYQMARGAVIYGENARTLVRKYKFGAAKYLADYLTEYVADCYFENQFEIDCLTYVPIHHTKHKQRGYNQAQILASNLSSKIDKTVLGTLAKTAQPKDTARLGGKQRAEAVRGVFSLVESSREQIKNKRILLVDDVYTTGATADECSRVLKLGGVKSVSVLTFATSMAQKPLLS